MATHKKLHSTAKRELKWFFRRNGVVRWPDMERRKRENQAYKKGYEVRLIANSHGELETIRQLLEELGFKPGAAFVKRTQFVQPLYGRRPVARFLKLVGLTMPTSESVLPRGSPRIAER